MTVNPPQFSFPCCQREIWVGDSRPTKENCLDVFPMYQAVPTHHPLCVSSLSSLKDREPQICRQQFVLPSSSLLLASKQGIPKTDHPCCSSLSGFLLLESTMEILITVYQLNLKKINRSLDTKPRQCIQASENPQKAQLASLADSRF